MEFWGYKSIYSAETKIKIPRSGEIMGFKFQFSPCKCLNILVEPYYFLSLKNHQFYFIFETLKCKYIQIKYLNFIKCIFIFKSIIVRFELMKSITLP